MLRQSCFDVWHSRPRLWRLHYTAEGGCATWDYGFMHQTMLDRALVSFRIASLQDRPIPGESKAGQARLFEKVAQFLVWTIPPRTRMIQLSVQSGFSYFSAEGAGGDCEIGRMKNCGPTAALGSRESV